MESLVRIGGVLFLDGPVWYPTMSLKNVALKAKRSFEAIGYIQKTIIRKNAYEKIEILRSYVFGSFTHVDIVKEKFKDNTRVLDWLKGFPADYYLFNEKTRIVVRPKRNGGMLYAVDRKQLMNFVH